MVISLWNELEQTHLALLEKFEFRLVRDVYDANSFNSLVDLKSTGLRVRIINDRGQLSLELASLTKRYRWWPFDLVLEMLGVSPDSSLLDPTTNTLPVLCRQLEANYAEIVELFRPERFQRTREELRRLDRQYRTHQKQVSAEKWIEIKKSSKIP